jgi:hypothetical protein
MRKKKIISPLEESIVKYLKKNRKFSKTKKIKDQENHYDFIRKKMNNLVNINYVIFQDKIYEKKLERFLYTDDTYVFILNDNKLLEKIKQMNFDIYSYTKILYIEDGKLHYLTE